jgi:hypothetical protein
MKERSININKENIPIDFESAFIMLNDELAKAKESLELICAGGYALQLNGYRGTTDVDAFCRINDVTNQAIHKVGSVLGINKPDELWLNNNISNMNPEPPDRFCEVVYTFSNLIVKAVKLDYLIGMKLISARGQDLNDLADIIRSKEDMQPLELMIQLNEMGFTVDISLLLDAFEGARGMDWLDSFYKENQEELRKYF